MFLAFHRLYFFVYSLVVEPLLAGLGHAPAMPRATVPPPEISKPCGPPNVDRVLKVPMTMTVGKLRKVDAPNFKPFLPYLVSVPTCSLPEQSRRSVSCVMNRNPHVSKQPRSASVVQTCYPDQKSMRNLCEVGRFYGKSVVQNVEQHTRDWAAGGFSPRFLREISGKPYVRKHL